MSANYISPSNCGGRGKESESHNHTLNIALEHGANAKLVLNRFNRLKSRWFFPTNCGFLTWLLDISFQKGEERRLLRNLESRTVNKAVNMPIPPSINNLDSLGLDLLMQAVDVDARLPNITHSTDADHVHAMPMDTRIKIESPLLQSCILNVHQEEVSNQGISSPAHTQNLQTTRNDSVVSTTTLEKDDSFLQQIDEITRDLDEDQGVMTKSYGTDNLGIDNIDINKKSNIKRIEKKNKDTTVDGISPEINLQEADEILTTTLRERFRLLSSFSH